MRFARLLFRPLDPLIVPAAAWRRGMLAVPRTALAPLAAQFAAARPDGDGIGAPGLSAGQLGEILRLGAGLWPEAAAFLRQAPVPADWNFVTGLSDGDHPAIVAIAAAALAQAPRIEELAALAATGAEPAEHDCEEVLEASLADPRDGLATVAALLVARLPRATLVLQAADTVAGRQKDPALRQSADRAIDSVLGAAEQPDPRPAGSPTAVEELRRVVRLLDDVEAMANPSPTRQARIAVLRRRLDSTSRQKFADALGASLLRPAEALPAADENTVSGLEATARELRRFEQVARRLGGAEHYDQRLRGAAEALRPRPDDPPATLVDRVRLIEILQGPEAAMAMIPAGG